MYHAVLTGNGYAYKSRDATSRVRELLPLLPDRVKTVPDPSQGVYYEIRDTAGTVTQVPRKDVFHLRGPSWHGVYGLDAVRLAREAIGLSIAIE